MIRRVLQPGAAASSRATSATRSVTAAAGVAEQPQRRHAEDVQTEVGAVPLNEPRDRMSLLEPRLVPKGERRLGGLDDVIISLYVGGLTVRDSQHHLARTLRPELSHETIGKVAEAVADEVKAWQSRPLEEVYPIVYVDALMGRSATDITLATSPPTSSSGPTWTASSASWTSGSRRPRARSSGPGCAPSWPTSVSATSSPLVRRADRAERAAQANRGVVPAHHCARAWCT